MCGTNVFPEGGMIHEPGSVMSLEKVLTNSKSFSFKNKLTLSYSLEILQIEKSDL